MKYLITTGITVKPADYESIKEELTLEFDTERQPDMDKAHAQVEAFVLKNIERRYIGHEEFMENLVKKAQQAEKTRREKEKPIKPKPPTQHKKKNIKSAPTIAPKPQPMQNPWTNYNKKPCRVLEEGWAFAKLVPEDIVAILDEEKERSGKVEWIKIGKMMYRLSGTKLNLVQRRPPKEQ